MTGAASSVRVVRARSARYKSPCSQQEYPELGKKGVDYDSHRAGFARGGDDSHRAGFPHPRVKSTRWESARGGDEIHEQIIIVTHSMGNFVARYASGKLKQQGNILGIVHLNPPTTGAPVLYRRFFTGSAPEKHFPIKFKATGGGMFDLGMVLPDNVFAEILGNTP